MITGLFESKEDVFDQFNVSEEDRKDVQIVYADYTNEDYSGSAYVLIMKDNKFFDTQGSHCSCMGLEDQWDLTETNEQVILNRIENGSYSYDEEEDKKIKDCILEALMGKIVEKEILLS